jgi:hypothetical protein
MKHFVLLFCSLYSIVCCTNDRKNAIAINPDSDVSIMPSLKKTDTLQKVIHVFVALCDNKYQGIVPVPAKIGNGQDPDNNLYWGCAFGIRSYFKQSKNWKLLKKYPIDSMKLERLIFKHTTADYYLVADAYNGKYIKQCTIDFLRSCAGINKENLSVNNKSIGISGNATLISYIGHDGLMDFELNEKFENADNLTRKTIILACISKKYFAPYLSATKANPLLWSTGLMSPEAYTLHDALESYIKNEPGTNIRNSAAKAYSKYQKCSENASRKLLVSGY